MSAGYTAKESTCVSTAGMAGPLGPGEMEPAPLVWRALQESWGGSRPHCLRQEATRGSGCGQADSLVLVELSLLGEP